MSISTHFRRGAPMAALALVVGAIHLSGSFGVLGAQDHQHQPGMQHENNSQTAAAVQYESGQAAYGAIAQVVARLEQDPATDWSKVNIEGLRQHLIDMDNVTMRSRIATRNTAGGFTAQLTGEGDAVASIRRMVKAHVAALSREGGATTAVATEIPGGASLEVTAVNPADKRAVARLRGLGAIGVMTLGNHHGPHHEGLARGLAVHGH